ARGDHHVHRGLPVAELPPPARRRTPDCPATRGGRRMRALLVAAALAFLSLPAMAVNPDEILDDPTLEARARAISANLRCLVCQNQSIDDSDAELARDLRVIVRERLVAGDTDAEATRYIVDRYGEFVLLNPVVGPHTILLWIAAPV